MFKPKNAWLFLAALVMMTGCQPVDSFNPLYTDKDVVFDPALLGKWTENGGTLELLQADNNAYDVVFTDDSTPPEHMRLDGRLVVLGGHRFLDLVQKRWTVKPSSLDQASYQLWIEPQRTGVRLSPSMFSVGDGAYLALVPIGVAAKGTRVEVELKLAHWFFRVTNDEKNLQLDYIDDDHLNKALEAKTVQIAHALIGTEKKEADRRLALTAPTAELQRFVLDHVNDDQVFADSLKFHRPEKPTTPQ